MITAVPATHPTPAAFRPPQRVAAIDLTKGMLVVCMVIYHSFNYSTEPGLGFRYLAFLPPSFILITGFLLSNVYRSRHSLCDWHLHARLVVRGAKLLSLFTVLNVLAQLFVRDRARGQMPGLEIFLDHWFDVYVSGLGRLAVFEVLLPIAYLILLAPALLWVDRWHRIALPLLTVAVVVFFEFLGRRGCLWLNAQMLSAGMVGMLLGRFSIELLNHLARYRLIAILCYTACFGIGAAFGQTYLIQLFSAILALAAIYSVCAGVRVDKWAAERLELLGRYSLVAYIVQIGLLQILVRLVGRPEPWSIAFFVLLFGTLAIMTLLIEGVEWARTRSRGVETVYKAVFA